MAKRSKAFSNFIDLDDNKNYSLSVSPHLHKYGLWDWYNFNHPFFSFIIFDDITTLYKYYLVVKNGH